MAGPTLNLDTARKKARIEIIPLIDVIFFLLATFVLFTLSLSRIQSLPVTLPVAQPQNVQSNPNDTTVYLQVSDEGPLRCRGLRLGRGPEVRNRTSFG